MTRRAPISVRPTPAQLASWEAAARAAGLTRHAWILRACDEQEAKQQRENVK